MRVVLSADKTFDAGDTEVAATTRRLVLSPGKGRRIRLRLRPIPAAVPAGNYYLLAQIDAGNAVQETSEVDNASGTLATPFEVVTRKQAGMRRSSLFSAAGII